MDSSVRDLLDGYLRDLLTAYEGLEKAIANHKHEIGPAMTSYLQGSMGDIDTGIGQLACHECWCAGRKPYRMGLVVDYPFSTHLCEPCAEKRSAKRDPFGGVTTFRSDE